MKCVLIIMNLPSEAEKPRAQRHSKNWQLEARAIVIWSALDQGQLSVKQTAGEVVRSPPLADFRWALDFWELPRQEHSQVKSGGECAALQIPACPGCAEICCGWEEHLSSTQRQMTHSIPPTWVNQCWCWPCTNYQTPCKYCSVKPEVLISNHGSEVMIPSTSLVEPG